MNPCSGDLKGTRKNIFSYWFLELPLFRCAGSTTLGKVSLEWGAPCLQRQQREGRTAWMEEEWGHLTKMLPFDWRWQQYLIAATCTGQWQHLQENSVSCAFITYESRSVGDGHSITAKQNRTFSNNFKSGAFWLKCLFILYVFLYKLQTWSSVCNSIYSQVGLLSLYLQQQKILKINSQHRHRSTRTNFPTDARDCQLM